jgi:hypothetical protein
MLKVVALLFALLCGNAAAQNVPTDNELFAAYCLGVVRTWEVELKCRPGDALCEGSDSVRQAGLDNAERSRRLSQYLMSKGYGSGTRGMTAGAAGLAAAEAGKRDANSCEPWVALERCAGVCFDQARSTQCTTCLEANQSEICRRAYRCRDLSFLPF